ncbi:hypothetical protein NDU88_006190 [Pleurodeles waltl]|uniref:Uncharacterized protein n=1 Tax=Pleurodeles waltl TaxID=8319 RepID=A0AAV7LND5_PLEWA|nr:hypothetical protein NDU88_006190 [Pleurodeles waltl]
MSLLQAQRVEAHYAQVPADNVATQQYLAKVSSKVMALSTEVAELRQSVVGTEEVGTATVKSVVIHDHHLTLVQSKIEDLENRQRRNNLQVFGIPEGREGDDPRQYIVQLFGWAFPDQMNWYMDSQIQRVHRLPINRDRIKITPNSRTDHPCPILVYVGNYFARPSNLSEG